MIYRLWNPSPITCETIDMNNEQLELIATQSEPSAKALPGVTSSPKRGGPSNHMNDLPYREWMKFQKSFFWRTDLDDLARQLVHFFT